MGQAGVGTEAIAGGLFKGQSLPFRNSPDQLLFSPSLIISRPPFFHCPESPLSVRNGFTLACNCPLPTVHNFIVAQPSRHHF